MTREEKLAALKSWFKDRAFPPGRLEYRRGEYIVDPERFVARQFRCIEELPPAPPQRTSKHELLFRTHYMRIYNFREYLKKHHGHE